jgi:RNA polymerase sigma-70 factor (ECF subfamily)
MDPTTEDALRKARDGDADAYGVVVRATQARLRAFIAGYVPRADWVDEIAQQAFVSAYRSLADFAPGTDFPAWLRAIAYNHLRAELEKAGRRRRIEAACAAELVRRLEQDSPRDDALVDALRDCVGALPPTSREIVQRYYADAAPLAEIGKSLGRDASSLKVTLFKIRARLRDCVERKRSALEPS